MEERARLARDLHDAVKQQLFAIQTSAATAQARLSIDPDGAGLRWSKSERRRGCDDRDGGDDRATAGIAP